MSRRTLYHSIAACFFLSLVLFSFGCKSKTSPIELSDETGVVAEVDSARTLPQVLAIDSARVAEEELLISERERALEAERVRLQQYQEDLAALQPVYFDFDRSQLRSDARVQLDANARILERQPALELILEGHCDENGSAAYNLALGDRRARAVRDYLVNLGIDASRLRTISYGKSRPAVLGSGEAAWAKNRRCEFKVVER